MRPHLKNPTWPSGPSGPTESTWTHIILRSQKTKSRSLSLSLSLSPQKYESRLRSNSPFYSFALSLSGTQTQPNIFFLLKTSWFFFFLILLLYSICSRLALGKNWNKKKKINFLFLGNQTTLLGFVISFNFYSEFIVSWILGLLLFNQNCSSVFYYYLYSWAQLPLENWWLLLLLSYCLYKKKKLLTLK